MKFLTTLAALFVLNIVNAQIQEPVKWSYAAQKKSDKEYVVTITAKLLPDWHIYSMTTPDGGPVATSINFKRNPLVLINGKPKENGDPNTIHDDVFGVDVKYFADNVQFTQDIKLKSPVKTNLAGNIKYMVCNDKMCLPPKTVPFNIQLQ